MYKNSWSDVISTKQSPRLTLVWTGSTSRVCKQKKTSEMKIESNQSFGWNAYASVQLYECVRISYKLITFFGSNLNRGE